MCRVRTSICCAAIVTLSLLIRLPAAALAADSPSSGGITVRDLPSGFTRLPAEDAAGVFSSWASDEGLFQQVEFAFSDLDAGYLLFGGASEIASTDQIVLFDLLLDNPSSMLALFDEQEDAGTPLTNPIVLDTIPVGDHSAGLSFQVPTEATGITELAPGTYNDLAQIDVFFFRFDRFIASIFSIYPPENPSGFKVDELAATWHGRLGHAAGPSPTPTLRSTTRPGPTPTPLPAPHARVLVTTLDLRDGPGVNDARVGAVQRNDIVSVIGQYENCAWLQVTPTAGEPGWIPGATQYVALEVECDAVPPGHFRPATDQLRRFTNINGRGQLTIENGAELDAAAVLTTLDNASVVSAYIRAGETYQMTYIPDGDYWLYFMQGETWEGASRTFAEIDVSARFDDVFSFETTRQQYMTWEVTLHPVSGGNATTSYVSSSDFPALE